MQNSSPVSVWPGTLGLLALAAALAGIFAYFHPASGTELETRVPEFIALSLMAGALYVAGVYLVERFPLGLPALLIILAAAVLFRLQVMPIRPSLSQDVYRYQWEGRVGRARMNPYTVYPAMPGLAWLQDPQHPLEAGSTTPTLYPPLSEISFTWVETVTGYKRLYTTFDLASLAVLLLLLGVRKQPLHRVLAYAWHPAVVVSFAMCGHHDSLAIATLLVAVLFIIGHRPALSIASLALAFLAKFFPVILLPAFLKRTRWTYAGVFVALVFLGYLPYLDAGRDLFKGLTDYASGWEANDSLFRLIRWAGNSRAQAALVVGVMMAALVIYALRRRLEPLHAGFFLIAGLLLLSPNAFPWYFTWSIPFLCFYPNAPWLLMTVLCVLGYSPIVGYAAGGPYRDSPFILTLEYVPVYLWLAYESWRAPRTRKGTT